MNATKSAAAAAMPMLRDMDRFASGHRRTFTAPSHRASTSSVWSVPGPTTTTTSKLRYVMRASASSSTARASARSRVLMTTETAGADPSVGCHGAHAGRRAATCSSRQMSLGRPWASTFTSVNPAFSSSSLNVSAPNIVKWKSPSYSWPP